jgi:cobalt-precorrin 5A hydrolase
MENVLKQMGHSSRVFTFYRQSIANAIPFEDLTLQTETSFDNSDAIVFISSCAVAVRAISPFINMKKTTSSVAVMDEEVKYVVSLISENTQKCDVLTEIISTASGAQAIIMSASEEVGYFGIENFVRKNNLYYDNKKLYKEILSYIISGETIGFSTPFSHSSIPEGLTSKQTYPLPQTGICVNYTKADPPYRRTLYFIPKCVTIGISCKKGTPFHKIENHILTILSEYRIPLAAVCDIASVEFKKDEEGIKLFSQEYHIPFYTYTPEEISKVTEKTTDIKTENSKVPECVCERCAVLKSRGSLEVKRQSDNGISVAMAVKNVFLDM